MGQAFLIGGQIIHGEIEIAAARHHRGLGLNAAQGRRQVTAIGDIVGQPGIEHGDQIAGVMALVGGQPALLHVLLHRGFADGAKEGLAGGPAGIDQGVGAQPLHRIAIKTLAVPMGVGAEGLAQAEHKQAVVGGGAGRATHTTDPPHQFRVAHRPLVGLLAPHGPAVDQGWLVGANQLQQQAPLGGDVVVVAGNPAGFGQAHLTVAGATRHAIAKHVGNHDAVALRIEHRTGQPGEVAMAGPVGGGHQDQVAALGIGLADLGIANPGIAEGFAAAQGEGTQLQQAVLDGWQGAHAGRANLLRFWSSWRWTAR